MKKLLLSLPLLLLGGCQTAGQLSAMSQSGASAFSCSQINSAFSAFESDRTSASAWVDLVKTINPALDAEALAGTMSAQQRYQEARTYANIALAVQGCQPL